MVEVVHYADPGCPWDYSAEPVRIALEERYGEQLSWRTVQVGLHESAAGMASRGFSTSELPDSFRRFQRRFGMPFCTRKPHRLTGTWAAARLVKAAELQGHAAAGALLRRLRLGWFAEARTLEERGELLALAGEIDSIDLIRLADDYDGEVSLRSLRADMALARRPNGVAHALGKTVKPFGESTTRFTTPSYSFRARGREVTVPGFQPREAYEVALQNLVPELERRPPADAAGFLRRHPDEPFAGVEVAAAIDRPTPVALAQLEERAATEPVQRTAAGDGELWSWGPASVRLRCQPARLRAVTVDTALAA